MPKDASQPHWRKLVQPYRKPVLSKSIWQLVNTLVPYFAIWGLMIYALQYSYWISFGLGIVNGLITVRIFIISHDCGHNSFFRSKKASKIVGFWTSALAFTPYEHWRHSHWVHHRKSGQYEEKGVGYFWIMGVQEYKQAAWYTRAFYRFYRNPFVLFLLGGLWQFAIESRLSFSCKNWEQRKSVWLTNLFWASVIVTGGSTLGYWTFFTLLFPVIATGAFWGLLLFYVQHHYEGSYWAHKKDWNYEKAALEGSSYIKLNPVAEWFAGSINYHHIHHLAPLVPNYRLKEAHENIPTFRNVKPLTFKQILGSWRLRLVDEEACEWSDFPNAAK